MKIEVYEQRGAESILVVLQKDTDLRVVEHTGPDAMQRAIACATRASLQGYIATVCDVRLRVGLAKTLAAAKVL